MMKLSQFLILVLLSCNGYSQNIFNYNLGTPHIKFHLPEILNEVSGLTDIDSAHVACVQDEIGIVFIYNFVTNRIVASHRFDSIGDFEGLTYTGKSLYVLRSDGRLTEWTDFNVITGSGNIRHFQLPLITTNNEGLCYDKLHNRLLIAAKSKPINHDEKSERFVYEFDLNRKKVNSRPVFSINTETLNIKAKSFGIEQRDVTSGGLVKPFNFRPSSLAVHPETNNIYIISAVDKMIVVINRAGEILHIEPLNPAQFAKAEGITFLYDGTMIITNEAAGSVPTLLVFKKIK